jgi:TPR repeat protein
MGPDSEAARQFPYLYAKAVEKREPYSQYLLGVRYGFGEGLGKNYEAAVNWLCQAADQGHADAQFALGRMYVRGTAVPPDYNPDFVPAYMWWRLAAKQDHAQAASRIDQIRSLMSPVELDGAQKLVDEWQPGQCGAHSDAAEPQK